MKPRILGPLIGAIAIGVGVTLLLIAPWKSSDPQPAIAAYGLCNVSLDSIPEGVEAMPFPFPDFLDESPTRPPHKMYLLLLGPEPVGQAASITSPYNQSRVAVDAATGETTYEFYKTSGDELVLNDALDGLRVGPWRLADPSDANELPESWRC